MDALALGASNQEVSLALENRRQQFLKSHQLQLSARKILIEEKRLERFCTIFLHPHEINNDQHALNETNWKNFKRAGWVGGRFEGRLFSGTSHGFYLMNKIESIEMAIGMGKAAKNMVKVAVVKKERIQAIADFKNFFSTLRGPKGQERDHAIHKVVDTSLDLIDQIGDGIGFTGLFIDEIASGPSKNPLALGNYFKVVVSEAAIKLSINFWVAGLALNAVGVALAGKIWYQRAAFQKQMKDKVGSIKSSKHSQRVLEFFKNQDNKTLKNRMGLPGEQLKEEITKIQKASRFLTSQGKKNNFIAKAANLLKGRLEAKRKSDKWTFVAAFISLFAAGIFCFLTLAAPHIVIPAILVTALLVTGLTLAVMGIIGHLKSAHINAKATHHYKVQMGNLNKQTDYVLGIHKRLKTLDAEFLKLSEEAAVAA